MSEKTAYDGSYLDDMKLKCRYLFKLIARNHLDVYYVIEKYMCCEYRAKMDKGNPLFLNKTPKQILGSMKYKVNLLADVSEEWDEFILEWMADIYTYMQWSYNISSAEIVEKIPPEQLYKKYNPLHETSIVNGCRKLIGIYWSDRKL